MRHYLFIWIGIAMCFILISNEHTVWALLALAFSWIAVILATPAQRSHIAFTLQTCTQPIIDSSCSIKSAKEI